jgi:HD-like signal output (HDOD) protein
MAARSIALQEDFSAAVAEEAFLAGILHDVGKLILATRLANGGIDSTSTRAEDLAQIRNHHAEVGAYLLGLWGFPTPIVEAVAFHHLPSQASGTGRRDMATLQLEQQAARRTTRYVREST